MFDVLLKEIDLNNGGTNDTRWGERTAKSEAKYPIKCHKGLATAPLKMVETDWSAAKKKLTLGPLLRFRTGKVRLLIAKIIPVFLVDNREIYHQIISLCPQKEQLINRKYYSRKEINGIDPNFFSHLSVVCALLENIFKLFSKLFLCQFTVY